MQIGPVHVKRYWLIVAFLAMAIMGAYGIWRVDDAANQNRALLCSIADLISRSPITQLPNESDEQFRHRLGVYHDFVSNVSVQSGTDCGADVSARLRRHLQHAQHLRRSISPPPHRGGRSHEHSQEDFTAPQSGTVGDAGATRGADQPRSAEPGASVVVTTTSSPPSSEPSTSTTTQVQTTTQTTTTTTPGGGGKPPGNVCVPVIRRCIDAPGLPPGTMIWLRPGVDLSGLAG